MNQVVYEQFELVLGEKKKEKKKKKKKKLVYVFLFNKWANLKPKLTIKEVELKHNN